MLCKKLITFIVSFSLVVMAMLPSYLSALPNQCLRPPYEPIKLDNASKSYKHGNSKIVIEDESGKVPLITYLKIGDEAEVLYLLKHLTAQNEGKIIKLAPNLVPLIKSFPFLHKIFPKPEGELVLPTEHRLTFKEDSWKKILAFFNVGGVFIPQWLSSVILKILENFTKKSYAISKINADVREKPLERSNPERLRKILDSFILTAKAI